MESEQKNDGFESERLLVIPEYILEDIAMHELTQGCYVTDIGYFPNARRHYRERLNGCDSHILIYCVSGEGWVQLHNDKPFSMQKLSLTIIPAGTPH